MPQALKALFDLGVDTWAVIHCPEMGCGMDETGKYYQTRSLKLPEGYIKGTVGAGDAFCAGVLYAAEKELGMEYALKLAVSSAAASLSEVGASEGLRSAQDCLKLYDRYHP